MYSENKYFNFDDFRLGEVEYMNIDLIILQMFKSKINKKNIIDKIEKDGFLDFVSKIDKNKFYLVLNNLIKFKCLSFRYEVSYEINKFGKWVLRLQLDLMSLFIIY